MRRLRREMTEEEVSEKSEKIQRLLFGFDKYKNAQTVMTFISAFKEPSTDQIISDALRNGKRVVVPVSDTKTETIILSYLDNTGDLKKGAYGIYEPSIIKPANGADIDFILIPGLAFDKRGNRLGFGKGYYDKLLCDSAAEKTALCYDFQLLDKIPSDAHDILMSTIITEEKIYAV